LNLFLHDEFEVHGFHIKMNAIIISSIC